MTIYAPGWLACGIICTWALLSIPRSSDWLALATHHTQPLTRWSWNDVYFHISLHFSSLCAVSHLVQIPYFPISTAFTNIVSSCRISCCIQTLSLAELFGNIQTMQYFLHCVMYIYMYYYNFCKKVIITSKYKKLYSSTCMYYTQFGVAQWVRAIDSQTEGWVFESQPRQTEVIKIASDSSTAKRLAIGVSIPAPCHSRCGTLKGPHCSMAMSAEQRSKFEALSEKILEWDDKLQTNKN